MKLIKQLCMTFCLLISMNAFGQTTVTIGQLKYQLNGTEAYVSGYVGSPTDVVIPATIVSDGLTFKVTQILYKSFSNCTTITSVRAEGSNLAYIGNYSFLGCTSLVSVSFPYAKKIDPGSFSGCSNLQYVWLGYSLTELAGYSGNDSGVFYNCTMLSYIVIPASCTQMGYKYGNNYTFYGCSRLQAIIYLGTQTSKGGSNADVYNVNNMLNWSESSFAYSGKSPTPTFTSNLPAGFQATSNAAQGNLEKNVGTHETTVPVTFRNSSMEFTANIPYSYTVTPVTLTARVKNASREYGEANPSFQSEYSGFVSGENSSVITNHGTYSTSATTKSNAGTYTVTQSGATAQNYTFNYESGTLTVTKAPLSIYPRDKTITYGNNLPTFDAYYVGLKNSENAPNWITAPTIGTTATKSSDAGTYQITVNGGQATNYNVTAKTGTLTINKANLIATTQNATREYGDVNPDFAMTYSGLKNGDTAPAWAVAPKVVSSALKTSPVGTYTITASEGQAKNYWVEFKNEGKLTVTKAPLTAKARSYTKTQGDSNPTFAIDYIGFKNGETKDVLIEEPRLSTSATKDSRVGTYPIVISGGVATNYELSYVNGTLTINPKQDQGNPTANMLSVGNATGSKSKQPILAIALNNEKQITGLQFDLYLPDGVSVATNSKGKMLISTTNRMDGSYSITGSSQNNDNCVRIVGYSADSDAFTGTSGDILNITLNVADYVADGEYTIDIKDIVLSDVNNTEYHPANASGKLTVKSFTLGDVDNSGAVNINDVVCIINHILNKTNGVFIEDAADVDGNGTININDVVTLINRFILHRNNSRAAVNSPKKAPNLSQNYLHVDNISIMPGETKEVQMLMTNDNTVAAIQGNIKLPNGLTFVTNSKGKPIVVGNEARAEDYTLSCAIQDDGSLTFTQYSPDGYTYEGNSGSIFTFQIQAADNATPGTYNVTLSEVTLSIDGVGYDLANRTSSLTVIGKTVKNNLIYKVDGKVYKTIEVEQGKAITPEAAPTKEGYTFSGWSEIPATMPANDVTVTGTFTINKYKLTYKVDGKEYKTVEVEYGKTITPETEPTKDGYTFSGWVGLPNTMPAKDVTVAGTFSKGAFNLIYLVDGDVYKTMAYSLGDAITPEAAPKKEGYTFSGWSEIPATMPAEEVTVTGTFTINKYKLTYKVDGEEFKTVEVEYGKAITPETEPTKDGYVFSGWVGLPATMPAKDVTVAGTFSKGAFKLVYLVDGEVYKTMAYSLGDAITPETAPSKEGYTFSGWSEIPATMPANDVTVTGTFTKNAPTTYMLTYKVDGADYKILEVEVGAAITPEPEPTKDGYTFSGWSWIPKKMPDEDVTITGTFTPSTGVETAVGSGRPFDVYTVTGRKVRSQVTSLKGLKKGVYIVEGKKVVVK